MRLSFNVLLVACFAFLLLAMGACLGQPDRLYDDGGFDGGNGDATVDVAVDVDQKPDGFVDTGIVESGASAFTVGGTVTGLFGTGLVLQNNGGDDLPIAAPGAFNFATKIGVGQPYAVTVKSQPTGPAQTCTVTNGSGTMGGADVVSVQVACSTNTYTVGGTVSGLVGAGLVLQNNGGNDLPVSANGAFTFPTGIASGSPYNVSVKTQPSGPSQACSVSGGSGTIGNANVSSVVINCASNTYTVGGTITGLNGTVVLKNNGTNALTLTANGSFAFSVPIASGSPYAVTVSTQPTYPPRAQTCTVTNGSGTMPSANVTNVSVNCTTNTYTIGGTVSGMTGGTLVLQDNGGDNKTITGNGAFTFATPIASGNGYAVTVLTQPSGQSCSVTSGSGTVTSGNVTNVSILCATAIAFSENFDGVTAPALPSGWTTSVLLGTNATTWATTTAQSDSSPNSAFDPSAAKPTDVVMVSPTFTVGTATATLTFANDFNLESGVGVGYDGGVLEISINGGGWTDIVAAGGTFLQNGYNYTISSSYQSPIAGRQAWSGNSGGFITTIVQLPASAAGQSVQLRWRLGSDKLNSIWGWAIDTIVVQN
jgi:hypothetical protein